MTVAEIDALEPRTQTPADKLLKPCDSEILLRALAVTGVVANHASTNTNWHFGGGADVLMLLVGFNLVALANTNLFDGSAFEVLDDLALAGHMPRRVGRHARIQRRESRPIHTAAKPQQQHPQPPAPRRQRIQN